MCAYFSRGKNKLQNLHNTVDCYKFYNNSIDSNKLYKVDYKIYKRVLSDYFKEVMRSIIYDGIIFHMPLRLGYIRVTKRKITVDKLNRFGINWVETVKHKKVIYHLNQHSKGYVYRFKWDKENCYIPNLYFYKFVPSRSNKRTLAHVIKDNKVDYYE